MDRPDGLRTASVGLMEPGTTMRPSGTGSTTDTALRLLVRDR
jgi:hypothetical protein